MRDVHPLPQGSVGFVSGGEPSNGGTQRTRSGGKGNRGHRQVIRSVRRTAERTGSVRT